MEIDYVSLAALLISLSAVGLSVIKFTKESKVKVQADMVTTLTKIIDIVRNDTVREYRELLRESEALKQINIEGNKALPPLDERIEKAARYVAVAYDKLGFIIKHDEDLQRRVLEWHGDDIAEMWLMLQPIIKNKWRLRHPRYAIEFERLGQKAVAYEENHKHHKNF
ncbi:MAG: hypothetical protein ABI337_05700 [Nitrososphaera sp.]|jgi:hypothetical protein